MARRRRKNPRGLHVAAGTGVLVASVVAIAVGAAVVSAAGGIGAALQASPSAGHKSDDVAAVVRAYPQAQPVASRLVDLAYKLGVKPAWLANVIQFESRWDHTIVNAGSGATGLIQFMPSTATAMGTTTASLRGMTMAQQFDYVERYFLGPKPHGSFVGRLKSQLDVFMAVFYPSAIGKGASYAFSTLVQKANPGIATAGDYMTKALKAARMVG